VITSSIDWSYQRIKIPALSKIALQIGALPFMNKREQDRLHWQFAFGDQIVKISGCCR
jgi:hypothetical protein